MRAHAALACAVVLGSCVPPPVPRLVRFSSSILLDEAAGHVIVTSPDDDAVVTLSTVDGAEIGRTSVAGGPEELARLGPELVVTLGRDGAVAILHVAGEPTRVPVPCGSTRAVVSLDGRTFVSCPDDDRIVELDAAYAVVSVREIVGGPAGLARFGDLLGVTLERRGVLATFDLSGSASFPAAPLTETALESGAGRSASQASVLTADPVGGFVALFQRVENDGDRERDPRTGGYGSVVDGMPRIEPRVRSACGDSYARFDGGARAMSGPSAVATAGGHVWIANRYTDDVLFAHCDPSDDGVRAGELEVFTTFGVGRGPRGIALSADGHTAFVDAGFDWAVSRLDAPDDARPRVPVTWTRRRTVGTTTLSAAALEGRSLFFDAVDTHLTPSGVVTCGTCHPRGGDDGLSWFLHTPGIPRKLRRTPPAWAARPAYAPFHWDGGFTSVATLARSTTEELMEGDGLLVDFDAIAAYLAEVPPPSPRPPEDVAAVERGAAVFEGAGCGDCHVDGGVDGTSHDVLPATADLDATLVAVETPPLVGVRARAPYFHDGRAPTLRDTVTIADDRHGLTSSLTSAEIDDLVVYLESL